MLMESIGLTPYGFRNTEVKRFSAKDINSAAEYVSRELQASELLAATSGALIVVKPIDSNSFGQFPNIRFRSPDDILGALERIRSHVDATTRELWVCKTLLDGSVTTFAGRYLVIYTPFMKLIYLERAVIGY